MEAVIPPKKNRKLQRDYDRVVYKGRHLVENAFLHLKQWRGIATGYAKNASSFLAIVQIRWPGNSPGYGPPFGYHLWSEPPKYPPYVWLPSLYTQKRGDLTQFPALPPDQVGMCPILPVRTLHNIEGPKSIVL